MTEILLFIYFVLLVHIWKDGYAISVSQKSAYKPVLFYFGGDNRRKGGVCIEIIEYEITISIDLRYQGDRKMHMSLEFRECIMFEKIFLEVISI